MAIGTKAFIAFLGTTIGISYLIAEDAAAPLWEIGPPSESIMRESESDPPAAAESLPRHQPAARSPAGEARKGPFVSRQVNVDELGQNIIGDAANEPSIAIDPSDPTNIVIGWRQFDTVTSSFRQAGWAFSHDASQSWTFPGVLEPGVFGSDPVLGADVEGNFYYYSLRHDPFRCDLFKSVDGGVSWLAPVAAFGGDKAWMEIDTVSAAGQGNIYCTWSVNEFTRSTDGGLSFIEPVLVPVGGWGTIAVGLSGEVYVAGLELPSLINDTIIAARSTNAQYPDSEPSFEFATQVSLGGAIVYFSGGPNPGGLLGQIWIATDVSAAPSSGNVYVLASVRPLGGDPLDVMFIRSTDGGETWSEPLRVNDDPPDSGAWQWFGTLAVAPDGRIDAVWNDTRNTGSANLSELFYSYSHDAGLTWSTNLAVSPVFDSHIGWPSQNKLGDYYDMISDVAGVNVAYAATFNGEQDVYFLRLGDCNNNGDHDSQDIADGLSEDCTGDGVPDECEPDCNRNGTADSCDIGAGSSEDCNSDGVPDECEPDCNRNGTADICDIAAGSSEDCNGNDRPDECEPGWDQDCNGNSIPDLCDLHSGAALDCNSNAVPDQCDITSGGSLDELPPGGDGIPDECQVDCNGNGQFDENDIAQGTSLDCDNSGVPDECEIADGSSADDNGNGLPDQCECPNGPTVVNQPDSQAVMLGDFVIFQVSAVGLVLKYQWRRNGVVLSGDPDISGAMSAQLLILNAQLRDQGGYDCVVTDGFGCATTSNVAILTVLAPCPADLDGTGSVNARDLALLLGAWGENPGEPADLNDDGVVNAADLELLLQSWGACP